MKNVFILLILIFFNLSIANAGNEKSFKNNSVIDPMMPTSRSSAFKAVTNYNCLASNKKVYFIVLKPNGKIRTIQVLVKDLKTGIMEMKTTFNQSITEQLPDPCYFACNYDQVVK